MRFLFFITLGTCLLSPVLAAETAEMVLVKEVDVAKLRLGIPAGNPLKPALVANLEDLAKVIPDRRLHPWFQKEVDFRKQKMLIFSWSGSSRDQLSFQVHKMEKGSRVVFQYSAGRTRNARHHLRLYALRKNAAWKVEKKER